MCWLVVFGVSVCWLVVSVALPVVSGGDLAWVGGFACFGCGGVCFVVVVRFGVAGFSVRLF